MAVRNYKNFGSGTLGASLGSGATSGTLTTGDGAKMPATPFKLVLWGAGFAAPDLDSTREVVTVTALSGDSITTMTRNEEGTSTKAWASGDKVFATATADDLNNVIVRELFGGVGLTGQTTVTTPASLLAAALSIPSGFLAAGDRLRCEFFIVRRGTQHTQSITIDAKVGGTSVIGNIGTSSSADVVHIVMDIVILSTTSQAVQFNDFFGGALSGGTALLAINTGTTALTIDVLAAFGAAATDTLGLENYSVTLTRATS